MLAIPNDITRQTDILAPLRRYCNSGTVRSSTFLRKKVHPQRKSWLRPWFWVTWLDFLTSKWAGSFTTLAPPLLSLQYNTHSTSALKIQRRVNDTCTISKTAREPVIMRSCWQVGTYSMMEQSLAWRHFSTIDRCFPKLPQNLSSYYTDHCLPNSPSFSSSVHRV